MENLRLAQLFDYTQWEFTTPNALACYVLGALFAYAFGPKDEKYEKFAKPLVALLIALIMFYNAASK